MTNTVRRPARVGLSCTKCGTVFAFVASAQVSKAQALSPWRGWSLGSVLSHAAKMLALQCSVCESATAPRPPEQKHPSFL